MNSDKKPNFEVSPDVKFIKSEFNIDNKKISNNSFNEKDNFAFSYFDISIVHDPITKNFELFENLEQSSVSLNNVLQEKLVSKTESLGSEININELSKSSIKKNDILYNDNNLSKFAFNLHILPTKMDIPQSNTEILLIESNKYEVCEVYSICNNSYSSFDMDYNKSAISHDLTLGDLVDRTNSAISHDLTFRDNI